MSSSHSKNQRVSIDGYDVPWTRQFLFFRIFVTLLIISFLAGSDDCQDFALVQIYFTDCVVLGVTEVQKMLAFTVDMTEALWMMKAGFLKVTVNEADHALRITYDVHAFHRYCIHNNQTVMPSV